jgi:hypothetical protein
VQDSNDAPYFYDLSKAQRLDEVVTAKSLLEEEIYVPEAYQKVDENTKPIDGQKIDVF